MATLRHRLSSLEGQYTTVCQLELHHGWRRFQADGTLPEHEPARAIVERLRDAIKTIDAEVEGP